MDIEFYETMCLEILQNKDWYRSITKTVIDHYNKEYYSIILKACHQGIIDENTWNFLHIKNPKIPIFYALPNTHISFLHHHRADPLYLGVNV